MANRDRGGLITSTSEGGGRVEGGGGRGEGGRGQHVSRYSMSSPHIPIVESLDAQ